MYLHSTHEEKTESPSLVILHGLFGSSTNWRRIAQALAADYSVTCMDLRNHGNSPWSDTMDYRALAQDVVDTMQQNRLAHPILLGHSMGGKVAMAIAQEQLFPIQALIVADIAPIPYFHDHDHFITAMERVDLGSITRRADAEQQLSHDIDHAGVRHFLLQNLIRKTDGYQWRINLPAIKCNLPALLDWQFDTTVPVRTLFIYGTNSTYMDESGRIAAIRYFPNAEFQPIPDASHWLHIEKPNQFLHITSAFLQFALAQNDHTAC